MVDNVGGAAMIDGTPDKAHFGQHQVVLRVTDSGGLYAEQSFTITVNTGFSLYLPLVVKNP